MCYSGRPLQDFFEKRQTFGLERNLDLACFRHFLPTLSLSKMTINMWALNNERNVSIVRIK